MEISYPQLFAHAHDERHLTARGVHNASCENNVSTRKRDRERERGREKKEKSMLKVVERGIDFCFKYQRIFWRAYVKNQYQD